MKRIKYGLVVIGLCALIYQCTYNSEEELYGISQCDTNNLTYQDSIFKIIDAKCATPGCHVTGGTGVGNFETYAGVKAKADNGTFFERTITQKNMPPGGGLTDCELEKLEAWLVDGAPEN